MAPLLLSRVDMRFLEVSLAVPLLVLAACSGRAHPPGVSAETLTLTGARYGKFVDVYASRTTGHGAGVELVARDEFVAAASLTEAVHEGLCALMGTNPDTLSERVVVEHGRTTAEFASALRRLRADAPALPADGVDFVPRDAVLELRFDKNLPGGEPGVERCAQAVRVAARRGGEERAVPARVVVRGDRLYVDPVVTEREARSCGLAENGAGLPAGDEAGTKNIEVRVATTGPLSIPGLVAPDGGEVVLSFRAGNGRDRSGGLHASMVPLRLVGALTMYLEKVEDVDATTQEVTLFKNGLAHEIDDGDGIRLFIDNSGIPVAVTEILADPLDDRGQPSVGHVRALVTRTVGLRENDPRRLPGYPSNPRSVAGERWLAANAPRAVLDAEFAAQRRIGNGPVFGDDPRNFVQWSPAPLPNADGSPLEPGDNVSPFAGAIVRFNRPVDPASVQPLDSLFCATRDLLDAAGIQQFVQQRGIDPALFSHAKFMTPHLVAGTVVAVDAVGTTFRLQAPLGMYLDAAMRSVDETRTFAAKSFKYYVHVVGGRDGIKDATGGQLDLQFLTTPGLHVAAPFALDMRRTGSGVTLFPDNHAVSVVRRFAARDEDEQPSYYVADEIQAPNTPPNANAFPLDDLFGAVVYLADGRLQGRPTARVRKVVDDLNQIQPPPQTSVLRFCPEHVAGEGQVATATASVAFGLPIQNPTNPYGARLQTAWREIDLSLGRSDPFDFNLDVEQMYWGVASASAGVFDEFDTTSLFLGHGEYRPENCVGSFTALPTLAGSGLRRRFADNYVHNLDRAFRKEDAPAPHVAYRNKAWVIDPAQFVREPNNINRYAATPRFERPYFTWRDEQVMAQGGNSGLGSDTLSAARVNEPYILAPFLQGQGRWASVVNNTFRFNLGFWSNAQNIELGGSTRIDVRTGGLLGSIALPLLADVWVEPFGVNERPRPNGGNGWQIALSVQSSAMPAFRAFSGGGEVAGTPRYVQDGTPDWLDASGGYTAIGQRTAALDNSVYWAMVDFVKNKTVATAGFVELLDPHRIQDPTQDPRLGPFFARSFPAGQKVVYAPLFDPPLDRLPGGTSVVAEYRGAGAVDPQPWRALADRSSTRPDAKNFPLDPLKAGDAHIRKDDVRLVNGQPRDWWTHLYTRNLTAYTTTPADLSDPAFVARFAGPRDTFTPDDVRYVNWRFVLTNALSGTPPASPALRSFALAYRFETR